MDLVRIELLIWAVLTVVLIAVPLVLLFKQQLPKVLQLFSLLREQGIAARSPASTSPEIPAPVTNTESEKESVLSTEEMPPPPDDVAQDAQELPAEEVPASEEETHSSEDTPPVSSDYESEATPPTKADESYLPEPTEEDMKETPRTDLHDTVRDEKLQKQIETIKYAALSYRERKKHDSYEKKLIEGLAVDSENNEFLTMLGDHYFETGNFIKALTILKKVINIDAENHKAIWQIAKIYMHENQHETAQLLVEKAIEIKEDNPKYLVTMVEIQYATDQIKQAILTMEKIIKLRPTNIDYLLTIANLHEEASEPTKAKAYYKKVLEMEPSNEHAKKGLKRLPI